MMPAYFIAGCLGCFACGLALGALLWYDDSDDRVYGIITSKPDGIVMPKPVKIPYSPMVRDYQPIAPPGWDDKNIKIPTNMRDAAWSPNTLPTSDPNHPAQNPFVERRKQQVESRKVDLDNLSPFHKEHL